MTDARHNVDPLRWLLGAAALVVVLAGLRAAQTLVAPMLVSAFLAILCTPLLHWLHRRGVPQSLGLVVAIGGITLLVLFVVLAVSPAVADLATRLPEYRGKLTGLQREAFVWLDERGVDVPPQAEENTFDTRRLFDFLAGLLASLRDLLGNAMLVLLTALFILLESSGFPAKLRALFGEPGLREAERIRDAILNYITIKTLVSLLTAALVVGWGWLVGAPYLLLWGLIAFLLNFVPNIGSVLAAIPPVAIVLIELGLGPALFLATGYLVVNAVVGNFIEPQWMGHGLGLSTLVVFISLVFWGWVLGPIGLLFSVPLTMILKIVMENFEQTRWLAIVLSANPTAPQKDEG